MTTSTISNTITKSAELCQPMKDFDGNDMPGSGIRTGMMHKSYINQMIAEAKACEGYTYRDTGKHTHHNCTIGQRSYCIRVEITNRSKKMVMLTFNSLNPCDYLTASDLWEGAQ